MNNPGFTILNKLEHCTALVITSGFSPAAYDMLRSLGKEGIRVSVATSQHDDMAFYSKYCHEKIVIPDFEEENYPAIKDLLVRRYRHAPEKPVLLYTSDPELDFVRRYRDELGEVFRFLLADESIMAPLVNKVTFSEFGKKHDLPVPFTYTARNAADVRAIVEQIPFPCIVKPAYSQDWKWDTEEQKERFGPYKKALRRFTSKEKLLEFCDHLPEREAGFLIQSYIDGRDEAIVSFHGYFDEDSRCLGYFVGRKIRTYPMHTGGSAYVRTIHNEQLADLSKEYFQRIGFTGIAKIDYKWDENRKQFIILEINPRYNLWELLGAYAGANLAYIAYRHQRGEAAPPVIDYVDDARLMYFKQDLRGYFGGYRKTGEWTFGQYLRSVLHFSHYRVFDPADPVPFMHSSVDFIKRNFNKLFGKRVDGHAVHGSSKPAHAAPKQEQAARPVMHTLSRKRKEEMAHS